MLCALDFVELIQDFLLLLQNYVELSILLLLPDAISLTAKVRLRSCVPLSVYNLGSRNANTAMLTLEALLCFQKDDSLSLKTLEFLQSLFLEILRHI